MSGTMAKTLLRLAYATEDERDRLIVLQPTKNSIYYSEQTFPELIASLSAALAEVIRQFKQSEPRNALAGAWADIASGILADTRGGGSSVEAGNQCAAQRDSSVIEFDEKRATVGVCGDECTLGNECGRTGCPNCQQ